MLALQLIVILLFETIPIAVHSGKEFMHHFRRGEWTFNLLDSILKNFELGKYFITA